MRKKIIFLFISLLITVIFVLPVFAQTFGLEQTGANAGYKTTEENTVTNVTRSAVDIVLQFLAVVFFVVIVYAGLRWMTARGNDEYVKRATHALQAGIIGIIITVSAYGISSFVFDRLSGVTEKTSDCGSHGYRCALECLDSVEETYYSLTCPKTTGQVQVDQVCCAPKVYQPQNADCASAGGYCVTVEEGCRGSDQNIGKGSMCPSPNPNLSYICCAPQK